jgi:signal transduction histidine kinase
MGETLKLLVVDDEEGIRLGIVRSLAKYVAKQNDLGIEVQFDATVAASGEEALEAIRKNPPDMALIDFKLPGMNGIEVLNAIKANDPPILAIMISAYASLQTAVEATKHGAYDFLPKPFTPEELRTTLVKGSHHLLLQRKARKLEAEQHRTRFELLSVLVHELKAPLAAVEGYLVNIREGLVNDPDTFARVIERSIFRLQAMRQMILDLLDMTRLEAGMKVREFTKVDLTEVAKQAIETASPLASQREITLTLQVEGSLHITAVRAEMDIVLNNLISNAVKYNRPQGHVFVSLGEQGDEIRITVRDTGIGLTAADQGKLFRDFVRIKNPKTRGIEGSGLGLSTVRKIATLYGGEITVTSVPDEGSTFCVCLKKHATEIKPR